MRALAKCVIGTVLVTCSMLASAEARLSGRYSEAFAWQTFKISDFGTQVEYPAGIFAVADGAAEKGVGQRLRSADGRALLTIYSRENEAEDTPASYLKTNLRLPPSPFDYELVTQTFSATPSPP